MEYSLETMPRAVVRRLRKIAQSHPDANYRRRANALVLLSEGHTITQVASLLQATRKSVRGWKVRYETYGESGLVPEVGGHPVTSTTEEVCSLLLELIDREPEELGYLASGWTSEMLAEQVWSQLETFIHPSTIRRLLPRLGVHWNRARPTLRIRDKHKKRKMQAVNRALNSASEAHPVFYVDEADVDLNPRIGFSWMRKGVQKAVATPGKK